MENYIKHNNKIFAQMMYNIIDSVPTKNWKNEQHKKDFKYITTFDYMRFLYDLGYLEIDTFNKLHKQYQFMIKLTVLCDRYKKIGNECFAGKPEQLLDLLVDNMRDWIDNSLDLELKKQEKEHYIKNAFSKEENPHQLMANRTSQLKNEVQSILRKNK